MQLEILLAILGVLTFTANIASLMLGIMVYGNIRKQLRVADKPYMPSVDLIVPCRGNEPNLENNILAILSQKYPEYRITFVVDSKEDPAYSVIEKAIGNGSARARILLSETEGSTGKINALTTGVKHSNAEVLAFADSDIQPPENWLRKLVAPLIDTKIGATTGFRWHFPEKGGFASILRSAWNAVGIDALANERANFVWGGSMAIRRKIFDNLRIVEKWQGQISDDYVVTREVKAAGYVIKFIPSCISPTIGDCRMKELMEWTTRQISIVRTHGRPLWNFAFTSYTYFNVMALVGLAAIPLASLLWNGWISVSLLLSGIPLGVAKNMVRLRTIESTIPSNENRFGISRVRFALASLVVPWVIWYNLFKSIFVTHISWRGRTYKLVSQD